MIVLLELLTDCVSVFQIGEFVYLVEGAGDIPLPSELLPMDSPNVLHVSSTLEGKVNGWWERKIEQINPLHKYSLVPIHFCLNSLNIPDMSSCS